jgi:cation transport regulator
MPYKTNKDLPENVIRVLPAHAQDIYREVFNHAWQEYASPKDRRAHASQEETAHKVAWSAVKKKYQRIGDTWTVRQ